MTVLAEVANVVMAACAVASLVLALRASRKC
jgi:hypothetical protein